MKFATFTVTSQGIGKFLIEAEPQSGWTDSSEERAFLETLCALPAHLERYRWMVDALQHVNAEMDGTKLGNAVDALLRELGEAA